MILFWNHVIKVIVFGKHLQDNVIESMKEMDKGNNNLLLYYLFYHVAHYMQAQYILQGFRVSAISGLNHSLTGLSGDAAISRKTTSYLRFSVWL